MAPLDTAFGFHGITSIMCYIGGQELNMNVY